MQIMFGFQLSMNGCQIFAMAVKVDNVLKECTNVNKSSKLEARLKYGPWLRATPVDKCKSLRRGKEELGYTKNQKAEDNVEEVRAWQVGKQNKKELAENEDEKMDNGVTTGIMML